MYRFHCHSMTISVSYIPHRCLSPLPASTLRILTLLPLRSMTSKSMNRILIGSSLLMDRDEIRAKYLSIHPCCGDKQLDLTTLLMAHYLSPQTPRCTGI